MCFYTYIRGTHTSNAPSDIAARTYKLHDKYKMLYRAHKTTQKDVLFIQQCTYMQNKIINIKTLSSQSRLFHHKCDKVHVIRRIYLPFCENSSSFHRISYAAKLCF